VSAHHQFKLEADDLETITALAKEMDRPLEEVSRIYASILASLKTNARVQDYLPVLASKKVRDKLHH
jgi:hypothetical protein